MSDKIWVLLLLGSAIGCGEVPIPGASHVAAALETGGVHLSWDAVGLPATDLLVERRVPGALFAPLVSATTTMTDYMDESPGPTGTTYRVLTFATDQPLNGTYSKEFTAR